MTSQLEQKQMYLFLTVQWLLDRVINDVVITAKTVW
jgi:hypothetical protein